MVVTRRKVQPEVAPVERLAQTQELLRMQPRSTERRMLGLVLVCLLLGALQLTWNLRGAWRSTAAALQDGEVLHLGRVESADDLSRVASVLAQRTGRATEEWRLALFRTLESPLPNVGALSTRSLGDDGSELRIDATSLRQIKPGLVVRSPGEFVRTFGFWLILVLGAPFAVHAVWSRTRYGGDELVLPILALLGGLGFLLMASVRDPLRDLMLFVPFAQGVLGGSLLALGASFLRLEHPKLRRSAYLALLAALGLATTLIVFGTGPGTSDAKINVFGVQPVELIKLLFVVFLAGYFAERWEFLRELRAPREQLPAVQRYLRLPKAEYALPPILAIGVMLGFFFLQRDLGPALVLSLLFLTLYAVARGRSFSVFAGLGLLCAGVFAGYRLGVPRTVVGRIEMWLSPWDNAFRGGDHLAQSLWAMAHGAMTGTGLGRGRTAFVPEIHTDMVLSAIGEELGFVGLGLVFCLYALLVQRGLRAAQRAATPFTAYLALGLTVVTAFQVLLIAGGVTGLLPLSGVVTPFLSYGRSALLVNFLAMGLLLSISSRPRTEDEPGLTLPTRRIGLVFAVALAAVMVKAGSVQVLQADEVTVRGTKSLQADGQTRYRYNPRVLEVADAIERGTILDRNGIPLATSDPQEIERHRETYRSLGRTVVAADLAPSSRRYPLGAATFHLLGDVNSKTGWGASNTSFVERDLRDRLQGFDDRRRPGSPQTGPRDLSALVPLLRSDRKRRDILENQDRTVRTTLDARLQAVLTDRFASHVRKLGGERGALVVLDADTGATLASVSLPLPAPAAAGGSDAALDRARYGLYPPGSTFKLVTAIAAQRAGEATNTYRCGRLDDGRVGSKVRGWGHPVRDDETHRNPHGEIGLQGAIATSCNAYFAQLGTYAVGSRNLLDAAAIFGIDAAKPNTAEALRDSIPQAAYGQGQVVATPMEMARVAATVASGGIVHDAFWVADQRPAPRRVIEPDQAADLGRAMRRAVTRGSAGQALPSSLEIAGKTGTAQVAGQKSHGWFVGFAPFASARAQAAKPKTLAFSILVENAGYGSRTAAPMAATIVREASRLGLFDE